jgi:hypothetical protein
MQRSLYYLPYFVFILVSVLLIESGRLANVKSLFLFFLYCIVVALGLEVYRNRIMSNINPISQKRFKLYIVTNSIIGIPLLYILMIVSLPMNIAIGISHETDKLLISDQQYLMFGYILIWFILNTLILRPAEKNSISLFILSPVILLVSSFLFMNLVVRLIVK